MLSSVGTAVAASAVAMTGAHADHGPAVLIDHVQDLAEACRWCHGYPFRVGTLVRTRRGPGTPTFKCWRRRAPTSMHSTVHPLPRGSHLVLVEAVTRATSVKGRHRADPINAPYGDWLLFCRCTFRIGALRLARLHCSFESGGQSARRAVDWRWIPGNLAREVVAVDPYWGRQPIGLCGTFSRARVRRIDPGLRASLYSEIRVA